MARHSRHLVFALVALASVTPDYSVQAEILEAQWEVYQIRFFYNGFNVQYSCDGIERKLRRLLILLGARNDARVESTCTDLRNNLRSDYVTHIQRSQSIALAFAMPIPVDKTDISREIIPAEWQDTRVVGKLSRYMEAADCELLDQFLRKVIPRLQVRSLINRLHCPAPRREMDGFGRYRTLNFRVNALKALEKTELEARRKNEN